MLEELNPEESESANWTTAWLKSGSFGKCPVKAPKKAFQDTKRRGFEETRDQRPTPQATPPAVISCT